MTDPRLQTQADRNTREDAGGNEPLLGQVAYVYFNQVEIPHEGTTTPAFLKGAVEEDGDRETAAPAILLDSTPVDGMTGHFSDWIVQADGLYLVNLHLHLAITHPGSLTTMEPISVIFESSLSVNNENEPVAYDLTPRKTLRAEVDESTEDLYAYSFPQRLKTGDVLQVPIYEKSGYDGDLNATAGGPGYLMLTYLAPWTPPAE